ncbi:MAG: DUF4296 domain-containing protein [Bacteroidales bacterium]|nr:DUF4296 domain-containing protein [Bacteroidales bacterium]
MKTKTLSIPILLIFACILFSCNRKPKESIQMEVSNGIIEEKHLVPLIKDVLILEAALYFKANQGADMKTMTTVYYNQIFEKHSTDKQQLYRSIKYYIQQGSHTENIFTEVVNELTVESDSIKKKYASLPKEENAQNIEEKDTNYRGGIFRKSLKKENEVQKSN